MMRLLAVGLMSAAIVLAADPPGVVVDHQSKETLEYIGSPSIAILPGGDYISSHDVFGPKSSQSTSGETDIFRSTDRGVTWTKVTVLRDQFWSNLFVSRGKLYLMGSSCEYGRVVIRQSGDHGKTWSAAHFSHPVRAITPRLSR